ncbi:MAG TPA: EamA family transporter [Casimicrobiaceae bacterium]|nr:EamA family transporter [Casimicrobiaceae bacterium]
MTAPIHELSPGITLAVLGAGVLHAGWNALLKSARGGDPMLDTASVVAGSSACAMLVLPLVPLPGPAAWKFVAASSLVHFAYYATLAQAYRTGDLSFAYPLMRGTAPLLVAILGAVLLNELPGAHAMAGIALICAGIVSIAFVHGRRHRPAAAGWAFANAAVIAAYTLVDASGARATGNAVAYATWLIFIEGLPFLAWIAGTRGAPALDYLRRGWRRGLLGGMGSFAAYGIALYAMTQAPVAAVAALRETSVLFAALIGALWLREGFGAVRIAGATSVVIGIAALRL